MTTLHGGYEQRWWDELSDSELRRRLLQRGAATYEVAVMVDRREEFADIRFLIDQLLGTEP